MSGYPHQSISHRCLTCAQVQAAQSVGCHPPDHLFQSGDADLVSDFKTDWLEPRWEGPY
ncbi:hypothetical protein LEMLEM_LOCUS19373, partial [Lemmus lemmus]